MVWRCTGGVEVEVVCGRTAVVGVLKVKVVISKSQNI